MYTTLELVDANEAHRVDTKIRESYYKSQHTGSFSKRRKKRARCADSYELDCCNRHPEFKQTCSTVCVMGHLKSLQTEGMQDTTAQKIKLKAYNT